MTRYRTFGEVEAAISEFIPLDKSWIIRMGIQDLTQGYRDIGDFLKTQKDLGKDLVALSRVVEDWNGEGPLNVGESGTIYRFVRFYLWQEGSNRPLVTEKTLTKRASEEICDDHDLINWSPEKLGELDHGTTQWQTMAYLLRDRRKVSTPKYKLKVTYDAVEHWEKARAAGLVWQPRKDPTINNQALSFLKSLNGYSDGWVPEQAEDYCFARAFEVIGPNALNDPKYKEMFESVEGHETPRVDEMNLFFQQFRAGQLVSSNDHRVVQAAAMMFKNAEPTATFEEVRARFVNPSCVEKTMPRFWDFMQFADTCYVG